MAKKLFISLAVIVLSLCCSVCFAAENNSNVNLGEEITNSLDKTGDSVRNVADDVMDATGNTMRSMGNTMTDNTSANNGRNGYVANENGYNAVRTSVDEATTGNMSTTTWIWIILAVAAIVIVSMVWYYAVQNNDRD